MHAMESQPHKQKHMNKLKSKGILMVGPVSDTI